MRRILYRLRPACLLCALVASLAMSACDTGQPEIDIELETDFREVIAAIRDANRTLDDKLALIEATWNNGLADNQAAMKMVQEAVASLGGTMEEKLAAIEAAVQAGTTGLETKLALIEAAMAAGFADNQARMELLQQAIASLGGPLEKKLEAIESALKASTTSLEAKIGLIDAAIRGGFADEAVAQELLGEVIASLGETMEEQLAGIQAAVEGETLSLSAKMALIDAAVESGFADSKKAQEMIQSALEALEGSFDDKLAAVETAMQSQTTSLETKLRLIEAAASVATGEKKLELIRQAVASLSGSVDDKLAAIESAVASQTTSLDTKLGLVSGALDAGLLNAEAAIGSIQTAIQSASTGLGTLDTDIQGKIAAVTTALGQLTTAITTDNLAAALASILSAIQGLPDYATILAAVQQALAELEQAIDPFRLKYVGEPTLTTAAGGSWQAEIQLDPANTVIDEAMLKLDILSRKQFFPTWGNNAQGDASSILYSLSLTADPSVEGKYAVTISCQCPYVVWDEVTVALSAACGSAQNPKYVSTEPFDLVMAPKALKGLKYWTYPAASFTFKRHGSINNIYYSLDSGVFETQDESDTRTYTAAFIDSVQFIPANDSIAPVFIQLDKEKRMIVFIPDTAGITYTQFWPDKDPSDRGGWRLWHNFKDSSGVKHESLLGKLVLTDRWHVKDTIHNFKIGWYNAVWFPESAIVMVNDIQGDNTAVVDIRSLLSKLGLERSWLEGRFILQEQYGDLEGPYFKMSAQLLPETLKLAVRFQGDPVAGAKFGLTAHYDLWIFPTETDPQFKVLALSFSYSLVVTIVN